MTYETLQYVDGNGDTQEVAIQNLSPNGSAIKHFAELKSHTWSEYHIVLPQPPEMALPIPFLSQCIVYGCRESGSGANNSFSGGSILFQGRRWDNAGAASAEGKRLSNEILLCDALRDLKQITYQVDWPVITGGTTTDPTFTPIFFADVVIFQNSTLGQLQPNGTYEPYNPGPMQGTITTWQQIMAIVYYATNYLSGTQKVNLQMGTVPEFTPTYCNWQTVRSMKCLDALTICLRPHPLVYTEVDYTTTPPTLHFRFAGNMTQTTLPYKSTDPNGNVHIATDITPLSWLVPARVVIGYQITDTFNGEPIIDYDQAVYPPDVGPSLLEEVYSVNLKGPSETQVSKNFTSHAFDPTNLTLWRTKVGSLKQISEGGQIPNDSVGAALGALLIADSNPYDAVAHPKGIQVIDHNNNPVDYADLYPWWTNEAVFAWFVVPAALGEGFYVGDGQPGAPATALKVTVKGFFTYWRQTTIGTGANAKTETVKVYEHEHSMRLTLTNAPTATYTLAQVSAGGEGVPVGLAETVWTELQWLQYKIAPHENWQISPDENTAPQIIKPGKNTINLSGGLEAWETMNAVPESVHIEFFRVNINGTWRLAARHTIYCGPVDHLNPQYRAQLQNLFANRKLNDIDPNQRLSGLPGSGTNVDLSAEDASDGAVPSPNIEQVQQINGVDPATGKVANIQTGTDDLPVGTQIKLKAICAIDSAGNQVDGYYAYGPQTS